MLALIIPVSKSDIHLLPKFVQVCQHLGHIGKHRVIFVPTLETKDDPAVSLAAEHMKDVCDNVGIIPLKFTPEGEWPKPCNQHFNSIVPIGSSTGCNWMFLELDGTPTVVDWANILETELNLSGKNYSGPVVPTRYKQGNNGTHMVGFAIYAHNMASTASLWKFCHFQKDTPFDIYHRDELRGRWHASKHIQHMWGTVNYRDVEGVILCEPHPANPEGSDHSGEVLATAAIVHGCKDGSLADIILSRPPQHLDGAVTPVKPSQVIHYSGNTEVFRLVKDTTGEPAVPAAQAPAPVLFQEEVTPEKHFERLCEALGLFHGENQDIYQMLLDRIKTPTEDLAEPEASEPVEEAKTAENAPESQEIAPETPDPVATVVPEPVTTVPQFVVQPATVDAFPTLEAIVELKRGQPNNAVRFTTVMDFFGVDRAHSARFKAHLNDLGFIIIKPGWLSEPKLGAASFATA